MKIVCQNKKATFEYFLIDKYDAGIALNGDEIKSIRAGHMSINEAFVFVRDGQIWLKNAYIAPYEHSYDGKRQPLDSRRDRGLLLHKKQIKNIADKVSQKGLTIVPVKAFFDKNLLKITIAVAKGKKLYDKKETIKQKDIDRDVARYLAN